MDYAAARRNMVENQVRTNKVTNPSLIEALESLPREHFVPEALAGVAYVDEALPLSRGRYLLEPMVLALLLQHAEISPTDIVLEIAPGTGYSTAVLARMASTVVAIEADKVLAESATANLVDSGIDNAAIMTGPLAEGYKKQAPYNVIVISGCVEEVPDSLMSQIADEGKLLAVVRSNGAPGKGTVFRKFGKSISSSEEFEAGTPMLPGFERKSEFAL
ncbi:MAG: protein-L-isoaspartate O-methyltransferase [Rhodospirillales bacterium]|nr:protein-L-isoaspartate O-methyltransferase [Rhodospirillales bacterium]